MFFNVFHAFRRLTAWFSSRPSPNSREMNRAQGGDGPCARGGRLGWHWGGAQEEKQEWLGWCLKQVSHDIVSLGLFLI